MATMMKTANLHYCTTGKSLAGNLFLYITTMCKMQCIKLAFCPNAKIKVPAY